MKKIFLTFIAAAMMSSAAFAMQSNKIDENVLDFSFFTIKDFNEIIEEKTYLDRILLNNQDLHELSKSQQYETLAVNLEKRIPDSIDLLLWLQQVSFDEKYNDPFLTYSYIRQLLKGSQKPGIIKSKIEQSLPRLYTLILYFLVMNNAYESVAYKSFIKKNNQVPFINFLKEKILEHGGKNFLKNSIWSLDELQFNSIKQMVIESLYETVSSLDKNLMSDDFKIKVPFWLAETRGDFQDTSTSQPSIMNFLSSTFQSLGFKAICWSNVTKDKLDLMDSFILNKHKKYSDNFVTARKNLVFFIGFEITNLEKINTWEELFNLPPAVVLETKQSSSINNRQITPGVIKDDNNNQEV